MYGKRICIDPGHGDPWPGAVYGKILERVIVLNVANALRTELEREGHTCLMTREDHAALAPDPLPGEEYSEWRVRDLVMRAEKSDQFQSDIFISIHCNSVGYHTAHGIETWHWHRSQNGTILAKCVQESLVQEFRLRDRGIKKSRGLIVLSETQAPAILVELGFLSNYEERKIMTSPDYPWRAARAIAAGVEWYFQEVN